MGDGLDLGGGSNRLVRSQATFRVNEVGSEDGIDQGRFPETSLALMRRSVQSQCRQGGRRTNADDVELETSLEQLLLDLRGDAVETDVASGENSIPLVHGRGHFGLRYRKSGVFV